MGKNITICFDGTCNHPRDARQEREWFGLGEIEDNGITNIVKLHLLLGGNLLNTPRNAGQHSFYYSGIGTYGNHLQRLFNVVFAPENLDVGRIVRKARKDLAVVWEKGDAIHLFGFSRGAALARRFASILLHHGLPGKQDIPSIRFLGVFDTVASLGLPNLNDEEKPVSDVVFENHTVAANVQEALHLVSLDENRIAFQPTLMNMDNKVTEIWFSGAHSDIGGGFFHDGLSDIVLDFLLKELQRRGLGLEFISPDKIDYDNLRPSGETCSIDHDDIAIYPDPEGRIHPKDRWYPVARATLARRLIRVNKDDRVSEELPVLHYSVVERVQRVAGYRPENLISAPHCIYGKECTIAEYQGINDHLSIK